MNITESKEMTRLQKTMLTLPGEVKDAFATLDVDERDAYIAELRKVGWTLQSIASVAGVTRERVRQIAAEPVHAPLSAALPIPSPPPVKEKARATYVEPSTETLQRLLELQPEAQKSRGPKSKYFAVGQEYTQLLRKAHEDEGVPIYRLALRLHITHGAIRSRLGRRETASK